MPNFRVFVEKKPSFAHEAEALLKDLNYNLKLNLKALRIINIYDIFHLKAESLELAVKNVLAEKTVDIVYMKKPAAKNFFAIEPLIGQYDQRADSVIQALNLLNLADEELKIRTGKLIILDDDLSPEAIKLIQNYYINPLETELKNLNFFEEPRYFAANLELELLTDFCSLAIAKLSQFKALYKLAMNLADLLLIQEYFKTEQRIPNLTEIKVLDTYWSDHCRHTTFNTELTKIEIKEGFACSSIKAAYLNYLKIRERLNVKKPISLMDLATINAKHQRANGLLTELELSNEINACSLIWTIKVDGKPQKYSIQFKNETHNHPTEIEPFGGASTCIGGAVRDPLSGRSYVYQAIRLSGAANPLEEISHTLAGKLPQKIICTKAAQGFASYGNQIGLATSLVKEYYHPGFKAKRMEVGMVVGAAPLEHIQRKVPQAGDVIILLGGKTGRDGVGGATGSSKSHDLSSQKECAAEVQKGNPVIERKLQRLFRNPLASCLIKKANDFGAGGVSVAVGELAPGLDIYLDQIPVKYQGLTITELALSESQERMAVVINPSDIEQFMGLSYSEGLIATKIAVVTNQARLRMYYQDKLVVDLARGFLDTNGAKSEAQAIIDKLPADLSLCLIKNQHKSSLSQTFSTLVTNLNIAAQVGLQNQFDSTIGAGTVLMPYGGKYQLSPTQVSVHKIPVLTGVSNAVTGASFGYDPELSSLSPFHGGLFAVVESVAKLVAAGFDATKIYLSLQEYFERLASDNIAWGKPLAALLGAFYAQEGLKIAAIGGKDSMSGTFNDLKVPPSLISFALSVAEINNIISPEFKAPTEKIYLYLPHYNQDLVPEFEDLKVNYAIIHQLITTGKIKSARSIGYGGILEALFLMGVGNRLGFKLDLDLIKVNLQKVDLLTSYYGGIIFTLVEDLNLAQFICLGEVSGQYTLNMGNETVDLALIEQQWLNKLDPVYPLKIAGESQLTLEFNSSVSKCSSVKANYAKARIIIPVFPGSNCEYDSEYVFNSCGGIAESLVFNNLSRQEINLSLQKLATKIKASQILMLPGGFSLGDEPDGSAKYIAAVLKTELIQTAIYELLERGGLILGICNGFQALIKSGLLPYGRIKTQTAAAPTLTYNAINRHVAHIVRTKLMTNQSPWLSSFEVGEIHNVAVSHGEGRMVCDLFQAQELAKNHQIASCYVDLENNISNQGFYNPNDSAFAIEGLLACEGRVLGKMGHSERMHAALYKNIPGSYQAMDLFKNGVNYFRS